MTLQAEGPDEVEPAAKAIADHPDACALVDVPVRGFADADRIVRDITAKRALDILVTPVPPRRSARLEELREEDWAVSVQRYLRRSVGLARAGAREMVARGTGGRVLTFASSTTFLSAGVEQASINAAMLSLTSALAASLTTHGVAANCIVLGTADQPQGGLPAPAGGVDLLGPTVVYACTAPPSALTGRFIYCAGPDVGLYTMPMIMENANVQVHFTEQPGADRVDAFLAPLLTIGRP